MRRMELRAFLAMLLLSGTVAWGMILVILIGPVPALALSPNSLFEEFARADGIQEKKASLEKLKVLEPNSAYGHFAKGWLLNLEQQFEEAITEYQEAIRIRHDFAEAHNGLGNVYYNLDKLDQALTEYQAAVFLNPAYIEAHLNIATLHYKKNRLDQAVSAYLIVIQINPRHAIAQNNLGNIYYRQGDLGKAIRAYREALKINPNLPETHYNLAIALEDADQPVEALEEYRTFLHLAKDDYPTQAEQAQGRVEELTIEISRRRL